MFLLFDYSFRPPDVAEADAVRWARAAGVRSGDEQMLSPAPWPSIADWCHARCDATAARLEALPPMAQHDSREPLAAPVRPRAPAARAAVLALVRHDAHRGLGPPLPRARGHHRPPAPADDALAARRAVRRSVARLSRATGGASAASAWYFREVLPEHSPTSDRFVPPRDPFLDGDWRRAMRTH